MHCRCIVQLTLLGYILVPIFTYNQWWLVLLYACFMLYVGCLRGLSAPCILLHSKHTHHSHTHCTGARHIYAIGRSNSPANLVPTFNPVNTDVLHSVYLGQQAVALGLE